MLAFLFPGEGSQRCGMGADLFDAVPEFREAECEMDETLGYSVRCLCLRGPNTLLKATQFAQPALFLVNALSFYKALRESEEPRFLAGHSLGEYNALLAAEVFDLVTGLRLVKKRGELMASARRGAMAAVIGLEPERITELLKVGELSMLDVASYSSASQTIISGPVAEIRRAGPLLKSAGARMYVKVPVDAPLHSRYMKRVADAYAKFLDQFTFAKPRITVISNATAEPHPTDVPAEIKALLRRQIVEPVRWVQTIRYPMNAGATRFQEVGPGNALTRLLLQTQH